MSVYLIPNSAAAFGGARPSGNYGVIMLTGANPSPN